MRDSAGRGVIIALCVGLLTGCSRQGAAPDCVTDARYTVARSAPPVQVPDDLSPPAESDALRLPPDATVVATPAEAGECLEAPPSFFGESRPFRRSADEQEADAEPEPARGEPAEPPAADGDRVIDN